MHLRPILLTTTTILAAGLLSGCFLDPGSHRQAMTAVNRFRNASVRVKTAVDDAYGYAIFPEVGKGGAVFGGALGKGRVYERGEFVGRSKVVQGSFGLQLGGQIYSELILFQDRAAIEDFKRGNFELAAQASAVAVVFGASVDVPYRKGVAVLTMAKGGLMYEASVGGQKFSFTRAYR